MSLPTPTLFYGELRCKSNFSFLSGASHPEELIQTAHALGYQALAISDRDGVYGLPKALRFQYHHPLLQSVKLISACELTLEDKAPLTLLAINRAGYGLMCRLLTAAHADKAKDKAALSWSSFQEMMQSSWSAAQGLIALPRDLHTDPGGTLVQHQREGLRSAHDYFQLKEIFTDRLYLPLTRYLDGRDEERQSYLQSISQAVQVPLIASNDVFYHKKQRRKLQDVLTCIREGKKISQAGSLLFSNSERYLKAPAALQLLYRDCPEALRSVQEVVERCHFHLKELRYYYPSEWIPQGYDAQSYLEKLTWQGACKRYSVSSADQVPNDVQKQLRKELQLISELKFADYFLTIWEIVDFARSKKILCQGRGSAANSAVCFCLEITSVDPVRMKLLFERFISVERGEPPDIDVDFEHERREEVIQHIYQKYGRDRAAMVSAVVTYKSRSSLGEISKALHYPKEKLRADWKEDEQKLPGSLVADIRGFPRHLSIHSGGFTLSAYPIIEIVPVEPARMEDRSIIQWDKFDLDTLGLLKIDVLSLGMLTAIRKTLQMTGYQDMAQIPADDPKTFEMIQRGDTVGVFQIESRAQINMLGRLQPKNFYDLVIEVAIVRPGPIVGQMVHPYLKRRKGLEPVEYPHPDLEEILGRTLGVPLFQEQVMKMAIAIGGFTPGEADQLRRAIAAWRSEGEIDVLGKKLQQGLLRSGVSQDYVDRIYQQIKGFAEYGFPESHAASFALLAYVSSYQKCHYPAEFTCALINSQPMGFYSNHTLVDDAKRHGVKVLPVDPNHSNWDCQVTANKTIRLGFRVVKGMSQKEALSIVSAREQAGPFRHLADFLSRVQVRSHLLQSLALGDAFQSLIGSEDQRHTLWQILSYDLSFRPERWQSNGQQLNLFSAAEMSPLEQKVFRDLDDYQEVQADYRSYGLSTRSHPMGPLRSKIKNLYAKQNVQRSTAFLQQNSARAKQAPNGRQLSVGGLVIRRQRPHTAQGICFATLEDEWGFLDLALFKDTYEKYQELFDTRAFLVVSGVMQRDQHAASMLVKSLRPLFPEENESEAIPIGSRDYQ